MFNSNEWIVILKFMGFLVSSGLVGWILRYIWKKIEEWIKAVNHGINKINAIESKLDEHQHIVERRMKNGDEKFKILEDDNNKLKDKLMNMISDAAIEMADHRIQVMKDFVSENNLKPKVVEIMTNFCRDNCSRKKP